MTTARSPLRVLKQQADNIAKTMKMAERGETLPGSDPAGKVAAARAGEGFVVGVVMDDKVIKIEMSWAKIKETSEVALAAFILKYMQEKREDA